MLWLLLLIQNCKNDDKCCGDECPCEKTYFPPEFPTSFCPFLCSLTSEQRIFFLLFLSLGLF